MNDIQAYNDALSADDKAIADMLTETITENLPDAEKKYGMHTRFGL